MAPNVQKFCNQLVKHQLISAADLEKLYRKWRASAPSERDNPASFAGYLVSQGGVTDAKLQAIATGGSAPTTTDEPEFDVELVPVPNPRRLSRRDLVMLAAGALGGAGIATLVGSLARSRTSSP